MLSITNLRKGTVIEQDGQPYKVLEYAQTSMGRGGSVVKTKLKNLINGSVLEKTFRGADKVVEANVTYQNVQFLYTDTGQMSFMNNETFETVEIGPEIYEDANQYLVEGVSVPMVLFDGKPIGLDLPKNVSLKVVHTEPGIKGDTATSALKQAKLETGKMVMVPLFINEGNAIRVDTRDGKYLEREK